MGTTNYGNQSIYFAYQQPGISQNWNKMFYNIAPVGIYSGGMLTKVGDNLVSVSPFVAYVHASNESLGVKVQTESSVNVDVTNGTPYIICRFSWFNQATNYADIISVGSANLLDTDIIIGRAIFDAGILSNIFDYNERQSSVLQNEEDKQERLKVYPTEPYSKKVTISEGKVRLFKNVINIAEQESPEFDLNFTDVIRTDALYVDIKGNLGIIKDIDTSITERDYQTKLVVAEVDMVPNQGFVKGSDIRLTEKKFYPMELFTNAEGAYTVGIYDPNNLGQEETIGGAINSLLKNSILKVYTEDAVNQYDPIFIVDKSTEVLYGSFNIINSEITPEEFLGICKNSANAGEIVEVDCWGIMEIPGLQKGNYYYINHQTGELTAFLHTEQATDNDFVVGICFEDGKLQFL